MSFFKKVTKIIAAPLCAVFAFMLLSCSNSSNSDIEQKNSDWLFLCYFDADDPSINDSLYYNMRLAEVGLAYARNSDGSPAEGYPSMNVVVLWDGISEERKAGSTFMHPDAAVFDLGADYELRAMIEEAQREGKQAELGDKWKISSNTNDLTSAARGWLAKEPDMGDYKTLEGFLKWAKARYNAKNVVINLNDHGAGPHKETYDDVTAPTKSLCSDDTNASLTKKQRLLTCKNIKDALKSAGWTGANKPKILWNDLCLQASAEVVYNFAGCADYLSASPNLSISNDYMYILGSITSSYTALDVGKLITSVYYNRGKDDCQGHPNTVNDSKDNRSSGASMFTWSLISLDEQKTTALKKAVDDFADALLAIKDSGQTVTGGAESLFDAVYTNYIKQNPENLSDCKGLAYCGTYAFLNDLGYLAKEIANDTNGLASQTDLKAAAIALQNLLKNGDDKLIVYAWGGKRAASDTADFKWDNITANQMYHTGQKDFLSDKPVAVVDGNDDDIYGMTIVGSKRVLTTMAIPDEYNAVKNYYNWTGFSEKWGQVINAWMEAGI